MENRSLTATFLSWWYGEAFLKFWVFINFFYLYLADLFSVKICFLTLFAPWKRDQYSSRNLSLQDRFQVWLLNFASRFVGFAVKLAAINTFFILVIFSLCLSFIIILLWLAWPLAAGLIIALGIDKL